MHGGHDEVVEREVLAGETSFVMKISHEELDNLYLARGLVTVASTSNPIRIATKILKCEHVLLWAFTKT